MQTRANPLSQQPHDQRNPPLTFDRFDMCLIASLGFLLGAMTQLDRLTDVVLAWIGA